jgi:hypothetical protein
MVVPIPQMGRSPGTGECLDFVENAHRYLFSQSSSRDKVVAPDIRPRGPSFTGANERRQSFKPLSTEGSFIPGETEEDGQLRREYVLVDDTRAVEFNRAVDGASTPFSIATHLTHYPRNFISTPTAITRPEDASNTLNG